MRRHGDIPASPGLRVAVSVFLMAISGCIVVAAAAVGAALALGTYKYANNELERDYQAPYDRAWEATSKAARDLGFKTIRESKDFQKGVLDAERADGTGVCVVVERKGNEQVRITARVGTFESDANRAAAQAIHERLHANMGGKP